MIRRLAATTAALILAGPVLAQEAPAAAPASAASTRCGGLLCDVYYAGKPAPVPGQADVSTPFDRLPCHDFVCGMFGGRTPDAPPPSAQQAIAEPAPAEAPAKATHHAHKKKQAAKAAKKTAADKTAQAETVAAH